jgi:hypothetical protein
MVDPYCFWRALDKESTDAGIPPLFTQATVMQERSAAMVPSDIHRHPHPTHPHDPARIPGAAAGGSLSQRFSLALGVQLQVLEPRSPDEFENAFAAMGRAGAGALLYPHRLTHWLDDAAWTTLDGLSRRFQQPMTEVIRQMIAQQTTAQFPLSWQPAAAAHLTMDWRM